MFYRFLVSLVLITVLLVVALYPTRAQEEVTPVVPTPAPLYTAPDVQAVREGKAPLRVLLASGMSMLAWKGVGEVKATRLPDGTKLYTSKPMEMIGLVYDGAGKTCQLRQDGKNFCAVPNTIRLESNKPIKVWSPKPDNWRDMKPPLIIVPTSDGNFNVAAEVMLEDYLRGVLAGEMPDTFHPQALRAQAIVARTYTLIELGRHADLGGDLCAVEHCQMYTPDDAPSKEIDEAIRATKGIVVLNGDKLATPYYHSSCGGVTDDAGVLWGPEYDQPYLSGVSDLSSGKLPTIGQLIAGVDTYCKDAGNRLWTRKFSADEVNALVNKNLPLVTGDATVKITRVTNMIVEERTEHGRAASLRVEGDGASVVVSGDAIRWLFGTGSPGPDGLWSTLFQLTVNRDTDGKILDYTFQGAGRGHGIGMCQWGANGRAKAGQTFREIIHAYYPGTRLSDEKR